MNFRAIDLISNYKLESLSILYVIVVAVTYVADPLALAPQLDAKENLAWASHIFNGSLPNEPFYRALFYPLVIGTINSVLGPPQVLMIFGVLLHVLIAFQVRHLSKLIGSSPIAIKASFLLYILNPVPLFFAMQVMDITMAMALFLAALQIQFAIGNIHTKWSLMAGVLAGLACLTRPHFIPASLFFALIPFVDNGCGLRFRLGQSLRILSGVSVILLIQGSINVFQGGEFRILPWQGSYNLYAANRPGANGLYFKQKIDVSSQSYLNPTRAEAEKLYQLQSKKIPPFSIGEMNDHWRKETIKHFKDNPIRIFKLWSYKCYAILNSYEQYNNLTYSFHKERLLFLRYNPLNFGILLVLSSAGLLLLWRTKSTYAKCLLLVIAGYSISLILYYASSRFRLPLVPILTILAGGLFGNWHQIRSSKYLTAALITTFLITGSITFSSFGSIRSKETYIQDCLLLANANADLGNDFSAASHAIDVLLKQPQRAEALRIYTISFFNMHLLNNDAVRALGPWEDQKKWVVQSVPTDPIQDAILGVYQWQWGNQEDAQKIWTDIQFQNNEGSSLAKACLLAISGSQHTDPMVIALQGLFQSK